MPNLLQQAQDKIASLTAKVAYHTQVIANIEKEIAYIDSDDYVGEYEQTELDLKMEN